MAPSRIEKDRTVAALREVWTSIGELVSGLEPDDWRRPSPLPGWDVQANLSHVLGTEAFLLGVDGPSAVDPDSVDHVHNPIGALNEAWVVALHDASPAELIPRFRDITNQRLAALDAMSQEQWDEIGFTPAGQDAYGRFMQIRVFDAWMHEQDIRAAVDRPGHDWGLAVEVALDEMAIAMGYVVGKKAGAADGSTVTFALTGPTGRHIHVAVGERATVVPDLDADPTVLIVMPAVSFSRACGGRTDAPEHLMRATVEGDEELGRKILENLSYTI